MSLEIFQQICFEFWQNSSQESKWRTILFPIEMKVKFWCNFCVYTKNWSFEKHRIGIIALLWQPILQKLNLKCCCHFCFLWLPTIWRDFFSEKMKLKKNHLNALFATFCKVEKKRFKKIAWIQSHHLQWKFKLWAGKFAWGVKAKHSGCCQQTFEYNVLPYYLK